MARPPFSNVCLINAPSRTCSAQLSSSFKKIFFISNVVEVDEIVLFVIVNRSCQCLGWESVVFVTVNWAGQWWGGKVLCLLL